MNDLLSFHERKPWEPCLPGYVDILRTDQRITSVERTNKPFLVSRQLLAFCEHLPTINVVDRRYRPDLYAVVCVQRYVWFWKAVFTVRYWVLFAWWRTVRAVLRFIYWSTATPRSVGDGGTYRASFRAIYDHLRSRR